MTFLIGKAVAQTPAEYMQLISAEDLFATITQDRVLAENVERLRKLRELDQKAYKMLKTRLPYFVGSAFKDGLRRSESFISAQYLTIDLDNCIEMHQPIPDAIVAHPAVFMAFRSPSGSGVKAVFKLNVPCADLDQYKAFYRMFSRIFAENIKLSGMVDYSTCDATRACFLSHDPTAVYNPNAELLKWQAILAAHALPADTTVEKEKPTIDNAALAVVLQKIDPNRKPQRQFSGFVPPELELLSSQITDLCLKNEMELTALLPINYGQKVQVKKGHKIAEINLFYGKRGFTITRSPKTGTDPQLAEALYAILFDLLFSVDINTIEQTIKQNAEPFQHLKFAKISLN